MLYDSISSHGHTECQDDVRAVTGIVEDIRDAHIDYQVGSDEARAAVLSLKLDFFDRWAINGRCMTKIVG